MSFELHPWLLLRPLLLPLLLVDEVLEVGESGVGRGLQLADLVMDGGEDLEELRVLARAGEAPELFYGLKWYLDNEKVSKQIDCF